MLIHLHKQATTTPKVRAAIQASGEPASVLAERFGTTEQTVYKWRHRDSVHDRSLGQQDALAGDEGLAQTQTGPVQKTVLSPAGM